MTKGERPIRGPSEELRANGPATIRLTYRRWMREPGVE